MAAQCHYTVTPSVEEEALWLCLCARVSQTFFTVKQLAFTYRVSGNELFISRKDKSITRATFHLAYHCVQAPQASGTAVTGPKYWAYSAQAIFFHFLWTLAL